MQNKEQSQYEYGNAYQRVELLRQQIHEISTKKEMWRKELEDEAQKLKKVRIEYVNLQEEKLKYEELMEDQNLYRKQGTAGVSSALQNLQAGKKEQ